MYKKERADFDTEEAWDLHLEEIEDMIAKCADHDNEIYTAAERQACLDKLHADKLAGMTGSRGDQGSREMLKQFANFHQRQLNPMLEHHMPYATEVKKIKEWWDEVEETN